MPKLARALNDLQVRRLKHPNPDATATAQFPVGGVPGVYLQIKPSGARSWLLRYSFAGRRREMGLGPYPEVSLAAAREAAREARVLLRGGQDPLAERKAFTQQQAAAEARNLTFAAAMERFLEVKLAEFDNPKHRKQWRATLDTYALPALGAMLVADIGVHDVLRVLLPIWETKTETASRLRGRLEALLAWATVNGHRDGDNPARWRGNLDATLPKPSRVAKTMHHPALRLSDAPKWFAALRGREGIATRALEFMAATAARSGEVRGATWGEIDFDTGIWTIPAARMKAGKEHRVPLTSDAVLMLRALPRLHGNEFVFPSSRGGALSDAALGACMRRINEAREGGYLDERSKRPAVPHGLRSTFRDWAAERGYPRDLAEIALAHNVGSEVERAYRRTDMIERRRNMMRAWGLFLRDEAEEKVVALA